MLLRQCNTGPDKNFKGLHLRNTSFLAVCFSNSRIKPLGTVIRKTLIALICYYMIGFLQELIIRARVSGGVFGSTDHDGIRRFAMQ